MASGAMSASITDHLSFTTLAAGAAPMALLFHTLFSKSQGNPFGGFGLVLSLSLAVVTFLWLGIVSHIVPEPYLDEVFHIPQAQRYCEGRFLEWDDKITTPPGLYWISILFPEALKSTGLIASYSCHPQTLRATNAIGLVFLNYLAILCRREMEARLYETHSQGNAKARPGYVSQYAMHTAFNIALFPLLFFFSGLYYTDVISTAVILAALLNHLARVGRERSSIFSDVLTILFGIGGLVMRQTNVFWVVVFMGGLEAVHAVKSLRPLLVSPSATLTLSERLMFHAERYAAGQVHDLPLDNARIEDMVLTVISLVIGAICNPVRVLRQIWPHITVLISFAAFVVWNGGVVLGDKSNHVATIHLAQMLYVWAFFAFFSLPLFLPYAVKLLGFITFPFSKRREPVNAPRENTSSHEIHTISRVLELTYALITLALSFLVVRYNTIIHPFTLADNRHYMFYVFRYTIRRQAWVRYALILPYTVGRWMVWDTLGGESKKNIAGQGENAQTSLSVASSTGLIFLLATALSLVTAPLVEPRYFIIPWVTWRLMVPAWKLVDNSPKTPKSKNPKKRSLLTFLAAEYDVRLILETLWFVAINVATGYIFLFKPYVWKAEDGTVLDQGRLQRFMW